MLLVQICSSKYWVSNRCPFCASGFKFEKQTNSTNCASRAYKGQQHTQLLANHSVHDILWKRLCQLVPSCLAAAIIILLHGKIYASSSSLVSFVYFSTRSSQQFDVRVQCLFFIARPLPLHHFFRQTTTAYWFHDSVHFTRSLDSFFSTL